MPTALDQLLLLNTSSEFPDAARVYSALDLVAAAR